MEYQYYLKQIYRKDGSVWIDILEAAQAEKLGYRDGDKYTQNDGVVYINGFDSPSALNTFIEDLHSCTAAKRWLPTSGRNADGHGESD